MSAKCQSGHALLHEALDALLGDNDDIGGLAALDALHNHPERGERNCETMADRALKLRPEVLHDWVIVPQSGTERRPMAAYPCPAWASAPPKPKPELRLIKPLAQ